MKTLLKLIPVLLVLSHFAQAEAPTPAADLHKTLSAAAKEQKLAFVLLGRPTCGNCNATKGFIRDGKIPVTAADYVMADLNIDDPKTQAEFMQKYGKEKFGQTLPFVVVTNSHGKALASSSGYKSAEQWTALLAEAKGKDTKAPAGAEPKGAGWPFKTAAPASPATK